MLSYSLPRRAPRALGSLFTASLLMAGMALSASSMAEDVVPITGMQTPTVLSGATVSGHLAASTVLSGSLALAPSNRAAFTAFARAVSDRKSPQFRRFLTPAQVGTRFGASASTVNATVAFLASKGLTVTLVADSHMAILFKGRADKVENAFSTRFNTYIAPKRTDGPKKFFSYATVPKVPRSIAPQVVSVGGLQSAIVPKPRLAITPEQARQLYSTTPLYSNGRLGQGINVGITNFDGYRLSNGTMFYNQFFSSIGGSPNITKVSIDGSDGETVDAFGEGDLDFQMVLAIAPRSNIYIYDCSAVFDPVATLTREVNDNLVDIVTESYGYGTSESTRSLIVACHDQHLAMTAQGITYLCASGDNGTNLGGFDYPDFDPDILMVGGTTGTVDAAGNRLTEIGWVGSGSGYSLFDVDFNTLPSYQVGTGVPTTIPRRLFPDVAVRAWGVNQLFDNSGPHDGAYLVFEQGVITDYQGGGTSAASPCMAGQLASILQDLTINGTGDPAPNGRIRLGRLNDFIYSLNGDPKSFFDITIGDSGPLASGGEATASAGWDFVTGWGAPIASGLGDAIASLSGISVMDAAVSAGVYSVVPTGALGTNAQGGNTDLVSVDGSSYSVQSVNQNGVGQIATALIGFDLQGDPTVRRSVTLAASVSTANLTVGYIYLKNYQTSTVNSPVYDLVSTIIGTGTMKSTTVTVNSSDLMKYAPAGTMSVLIRSTKPARLGAAPFRLNVDQAMITERIPKAAG